MTRSMFLFYFSISLAILSSALYHFSAKSTPSNVNFTVSLMVTYFIAFGVASLGFLFFPIQHGILAELKRLNCASVILAVAVVGIEYGFLLIYRAGWNLSVASIVAITGSSLILIPLAIFVFKDKLNWVNAAGIVFCLAGMVMLNWKQ